MDFIFGGGTAYFEDCEIHCMAAGFITAPSTSATHPFGFVFAGGRITAAPGDWKTFLGPPWRPHGGTTFLETTMPANIRPAGWDNWRNAENEKTARFSEYASKGRLRSRRAISERRLAGAVGRGVQCILDARYRQNGRPTVWGAQHEPLTFCPDPGPLDGAEVAERG